MSSEPKKYKTSRKLVGPTILALVAAIAAFFVVDYSFGVAIFVFASVWIGLFAVEAVINA